MDAINKPELVSKQYQKDIDWIFANYTKLAKQYPNKWVACVKHKILAVGNSMTKALQVAQRKSGMGQIPVIFIEKGIHIYGN